MSELDQNNSNKPAIAYPSSSILLLRSGIEGFEVLMAKRSESLRFAPGAYVFPGGKVDEEDHINNPEMGFDDAAYRTAALRELAEETGVNIAYSKASELVFFAHWVTPPESPKRFETRFYLAVSEEEHVLVKDGTETDEVMWVDPKRMLHDEEAGLVNMMFPTRLNLMKLCQSATIDEALSKAKAEETVKVMPEHELRNGEMWFTIPKSAGYPVHEVKRENIFELMGVKK